MTVGPSDMDRRSSDLWAFEEFQLDPQRSALLRDGARVQVTPKALDVLLHLLRNRGRTVSKTELLQVVWNGTAVEDHTVDVTMSVLRRALGERPKDARYILTIPGNGYRFIANLKSVPGDGPAESPGRLQKFVNFASLTPLSLPTNVPGDWHRPVDPGSEVGGKTLGQWLVTYFRHMWERAGRDHPLLFEGPDYGVVDVVDGAAILFKSWLTKSKTERSVRLPLGASVLVPVLVYSLDTVGFSSERRERVGEPEMASSVRSIVDEFADLVLEVDGHGVDDLRAFRTGPQRYSCRPGPESLYHRIGLQPPELVEPAFGDGYLAILPPPPVGEHVIRFGGTGPIGGERVRSEAIYRISV